MWSVLLCSRVLCVQGRLPGLTSASAASLAAAGILSYGKLTARYFGVERSKVKFQGLLMLNGMEPEEATLCAEAIDQKIGHT